MTGCEGSIAGSGTVETGWNPSTVASAAWSDVPEPQRLQLTDSKVASEVKAGRK